MIDLSGNHIECNNINDLIALDNFIDNHQELRKIKLQQNKFIYGIKSLLDSKGNKKEEIKNIIQRFIDKNVKIVLENELKDFVIKNKTLANLFLYKNKTY